MVEKTRLSTRKRSMIRRIAFTEAGAAEVEMLRRLSVKHGFKYTHTPLRTRPLCGAKTRAGTPCRCFALRNGRCKLHGGLSTGPKTSEGWQRTRAGYSAWRQAQKAAKEERR